jgi:cytochrome c
LPNNEWGKTVRFGRKLTVATYADLGSGIADPAKRFAGSNMSCQSCHLEAGTKKFGLPFVGVFADFPQYRSREGEVGTLEERINGCMTRSLNGRALPVGSDEMKAFVAYSNSYPPPADRRENPGARFGGDGRTDATGRFLSRRQGLRADLCRAPPR